MRVITIYIYCLWSYNAELCDCHYNTYYGGGIWYSHNYHHAVQNDPAEGMINSSSCVFMHCLHIRQHTNSHIIFLLWEVKAIICQHCASPQTRHLPLKWVCDSSDLLLTWIASSLCVCVWEMWRHCERHTPPALSIPTSAVQTETAGEGRRCTETSVSGAGWQWHCFCWHQSHRSEYCGLATFLYISEANQSDMLKVTCWFFSRYNVCLVQHLSLAC